MKTHFVNFKLGKCNNTLEIYHFIDKYLLENIFAAALNHQALEKNVRA